MEPAVATQNGRGMQNKSEVNKEGWEDSAFPIVCETCLGDNPYVRIQRQKFGQACKICERPFTVFRWRPGGMARYKKTQACQQCSKAKNVCQVCILDLNYGLPVQVRDSFLKKAGAGNEIAIPDSDPNREYYMAQQRQLTELGQDSTHQNSRVHHELLKMARKTPYYRRNLPHICSFFVKGECNRGLNCPYRHEMPAHEKDDPLSNQKTKDRYYGVDDPVAMKMLNRAKERPSLQAPENQSISTLWIGGLTDRISEGNLRDMFYHYGEIRAIKVVPRQQCAFVEFTTRDAAQRAAKAKYNNCVIKGVKLAVNWSKDVKNGSQPVVHGAPRGPMGPGAPPPAPHTMPIPGYNPHFPVPNVPTGFRSFQYRPQQPSGGAPRVAMPAGPSVGAPPGPPGPPAPRGYPRPPPPPPRNSAPMYPSMNPSRMGARA